MTDLFGHALLEYLRGNRAEDLVVHTSVALTESTPLSYFFRDYQDMPYLEKKALDLCRGKVLDVGSGAGSHSLHLQQKGFDITALDRSPGAIEVCSLRGIKKTILCNIYELYGTKFDTILLLMNGLGVAGSLARLPSLLEMLKRLLNPKGQVLVDSSDLIYLFEQDEDGGIWVPGNTEYYGEVTYQLEFQGKRGSTFSWLFLDFNRLHKIAQACDLSCQLVMAGEHYDYLAKLEHKP